MDTAPVSHTEHSEPLHVMGRSLGARLTLAGIYALYFALAVIYFWFGGMKFTAYEAAGIKGFVGESPLLSWMYQFMSTQGFSYFLGVVELFIAVMITARIFSPVFSAIGGILSTGLFLTTLTFMLSTPGVFEPSLGFPAISVVPGQFLLKDLGLLAASILIVGTSISAIEHQNRPRN